MLNSILNKILNSKFTINSYVYFILYTNKYIIIIIYLFVIILNIIYVACSNIDYCMGNTPDWSSVWASGSTSNYEPGSGSRSTSISECVSNSVSATESAPISNVFSKYFYIPASATADGGYVSDSDLSIKSTGSDNSWHSYRPLNTKFTAYHEVIKDRKDIWINNQINRRMVLDMLHSKVYWKKPDDVHEVWWNARKHQVYTEKFGSIEDNSWDLKFWSRAQEIIDAAKWTLKRLPEHNMAETEAYMKIKEAKFMIVLEKNVDICTAAYEYNNKGYSSPPSPVGKGNILFYNFVRFESDYK